MAATALQRWRQRPRKSPPASGLTTCGGVLLYSLWFQNDGVGCYIQGWWWWRYTARGRETKRDKNVQAVKAIAVKLSTNAYKTLVRIKNIAIRLYEWVGLVCWWYPLSNRPYLNLWVEMGSWGVVKLFGSQMRQPPSKCWSFGWSPNPVAKKFSTPFSNPNQDMKKTEYLVKYSLDLSFNWFWIVYSASRCPVLRPHDHQSMT